MLAPRQQLSLSSRSPSLRGEEKEEAEGSLLVRSVELLLICRRSSKRGGTRYNARGIDDEGNVSEAVCERRAAENQREAGLESGMAVRGPGVEKVATEGVFSCPSF